MPLKSVTNNGRRDLAARGPASHILSKMSGERLQIDWPVGNFAATESGAQATLSIFGSGQVAEGPVVSIPRDAGLDTPLVLVPVFWTVDLAPGSYQLISRVRETDPGGTELATHQFTLNVLSSVPPAPTAPDLFVQGEPTIS